jgi:hypothetical protein
MMTEYRGPRRTRLVVYSCCRSVCILHFISFHWGLRKMGENPIMGSTKIEENPEPLKCI